jgi:hypothetical protein
VEEHSVVHGADRFEFRELSNAITRRENEREDIYDAYGSRCWFKVSSHALRKPWVRGSSGKLADDACRSHKHPRIPM